MLKYLVILLDDTSVSFCHYHVKKEETRLIDIENLKAGIHFAMLENLNIQFVYPDYDIPQSYKDIIATVSSSSIVPHGQCGNVIVINNWDIELNEKIDEQVSHVLRTSKNDFFNRYKELEKWLYIINRLNIVFTDLDEFTTLDFETYKEVLEKLSSIIKDIYITGHNVQVNVLTDRVFLENMNNCNAGYETITLAPDGNFYVCPAFYYDEKSFHIGNLVDGINVKNPQLYKREYASLCRKCDAFQCRRCVYLNRKMTYEVNIPSHEQCVTAHLERNASRELLENMKESGIWIIDRQIPSIDYLDPFDIKEQF